MGNTKRFQDRKGTRTAAALIGLILAGCEMVDPSPEASPIPKNEVVTSETGPAATCRAIPSSLGNGPDYLQATFASNACAKLRVCVDPDAWKDLSHSTYIPGIDIVILFDTTGSMSPYINAMIANMQQLITNLNDLTPSLRLGLASYKDFGDRSGTRSDYPFVINVPLTATVNDVSVGLSTLRATGGGDARESLAEAVRAAATGRALEPYFGATNMGFVDDPSRIKIILAVTDAANRTSNIPAGGATLDDAAAAMKERGILFMGIGRKLPGASATAPGTIFASTTPAGNDTSYSDLAFLAQKTGTLVASPGIDLDGDGRTVTYGELNTGDPAVLLMTGQGKLEGAPNTSNPTKVLADAITQMVKKTRPFSFTLSVNSRDRVFTPESNTMAVPPEAVDQHCFSVVSFDAINPALIDSACPVSSFVRVSSTEETTASRISGSQLKATLEVDATCGVLPAPSPTPTPTPTPSPSEAPGCTGPSCNGGPIGI